MTRGQTLISERVISGHFHAKETLDSRPLGTGLGERGPFTNTIRRRAIGRSGTVGIVLATCGGLALWTLALGHHGPALRGASSSNQAAALELPALAAAASSARVAHVEPIVAAPPESRPPPVEKLNPATQAAQPAASSRTLARPNLAQPLRAPVAPAPTVQPAASKPSAPPLPKGNTRPLDLLAPY